MTYVNFNNEGINRSIDYNSNPNYLIKSYDVSNELLYLREEVHNLKYKLNDSERVNQELYNDLVTVEKELDTTNQQFARYEKDLLEEIKMLDSDVLNL